MKVTEILELILETGCEPEDACAHAPELLPEVLERLRQVRRAEQQLNQLFPDSKSLADKSPPSHGPRAILNRLPTIDGYTMEGVLGSGGMGVVYKARHLKLNRVVALKMLRAGHFATSDELTRFAREFQAIAEMQCSHIVQIFDVGDIDGRPYYTMEYVDGGSLADDLRGAPQPAQKSATLVAEIAEAIHSAHQRGIVHRDLKPANILLSQDGCPKIADFGLARHIEGDQPLTISGAQLGTPSYMAPEQTHRSADFVGPAADVYALGAILYEMLTGRPPFRAETAIETQRQVLHVDPVSPARINASVPRDLETICLCCLKKEPSRRYDSALALADDLKRFLRHEAISVRPTGRVERALRWMHRNPELAALVCTAAVLGCLAVAFAWREVAAAEQQFAEVEKWKQRLEFVTKLEQEGRFNEARAILEGVPDGGSNEMRGRIKQAESELALAERLDLIRMSRGTFTQGGGIDYAEPSRWYGDAFREAGIGQPGDSPNQVADRIKRLAVSSALIAALDDWAACADAQPRDWILSVARQADPDPWRDRVRDNNHWASIEHLQSLADSVKIGEQPVSILVAMGTRWRRLGGKPESYLQRIHHQYPSDFWVNFELGMIQHEANDHTAALAHNLAALVVRPKSAATHFNCGVAYERLGRTEEARYYFTRTLELDASHSWAEYRLGIVLFNSGQSEEAIEHFRRALKLDPNHKDARNGLRIALIETGQLQEAVFVWDSTLNDPTATHQDVDGIAELYLYLGREEEYRRACERMLNRFGSTVDPLVCERLGRACLLKSTSDETLRKAVALIDHALSANLPGDQQWAKPYIHFAKALSDYRTGDFDAALAWLEGEAATVLPPAPDFLRAMVLLRLNKLEASKQAFIRAQEQLSEQSQVNNREAWLYAILSREAQASLDLTLPVRSSR